MGYEITSLDIWAAYRHTMEAATNAGILQETRSRIQRLVQTSTIGFVTEVLSRELGGQ